MTADSDAARNSQWLKGVLDLCALSLLSDRERYGYEIARILDDAGLGPIKGGTLYPLLARLENDGLVSTTWKPSDQGPERKYYRLADRGRLLLEVNISAWREFADRVTSVMERKST
jgi:PadR family transcriptional regulator PadR